MKMKITEFSKFFFKNVLCSDNVLTGVYLIYYFKSKSFELSFGFNGFHKKFLLDNIPLLGFSVNSYYGLNMIDFDVDCYSAYYKVLPPFKFSFSNFDVKFSEDFVAPVWCDKADEKEVKEVWKITKNLISGFKRDYFRLGLTRFYFLGDFHVTYVFDLPPNSYYRGGDLYCFRYSNRNICLDISFWVISYDFYLEFPNDFLKFLNSYLKKVNCCLCSIYEDQILEKIGAINKVLGG